MTWKSLEAERQLKPFAKSLIEDQRTLFCFTQPASLENPGLLEWHSSERDADTFAIVAKLIWKTTDFSDRKFIQHVHPHIVARLQESPLFTTLYSPDIQVTKGHQGTRPAQHSLQVAESLVTDGLGLLPEHICILRLAPYYHDVGKGISAGIPADEVRQYMREYNCLSHSSPGHAAISFLALETMSRYQHVQQIQQTIGQETWQKFLLLIRNHHVLEFVDAHNNRSVEEIEQEVRTIMCDPLQLETLILTLIFTFADIMATPAYQQYWPGKFEATSQVLTLLKAGMEEQLQLLFSSVHAGFSQQLAIALLAGQQAAEK